MAVWVDGEEQVERKQDRADSEVDLEKLVRHIYGVMDRLFHAGSADGAHRSG